MIQIGPGNLIAVEAAGSFYYAVIIERIKVFGGAWCFAFHRTSASLLEAAEVLGGPQQGFNAFVDFIWAKKEERITRLAKSVSTTPYLGPGLLKATHATKEKAKVWFIYDMSFQEIKRTEQLNEAERKYPFPTRIDDTTMVKRISEQWLPENDRRI